MKAHIIVRLVMHILVLGGILGFFAIFPRSWQNILPPIIPINLLITTPAYRNLLMLGDVRFWAHFVSFWALWTLILVSIAALVMDVRMLRTSNELQARLSRSVALELLLPAGWCASIVVIRSVAGFGGNFDPPPLVEPTWVWVMLPGSAIALSALASAVVAWLVVKDRAKAAVKAARVWITGAIALLLTLIAVALISLFAFVGLVLVLYLSPPSTGGP